MNVRPEPARALVVRGARSLQTDPAMVALGVLAILAAAIGNARTVELVPGWREPAVLCCAVVAPSGTGKSHALKLATERAEARDRDSDEWGEPAPRALTLDAEAVSAWAAYYDEVNARIGLDSHSTAITNTVVVELAKKASPNGRGK